MTPKPYLSHSQKILWETQPETYVEQYMYNGQRYTSRAQAYGSKVHTAIENGGDSGDIEIDLLVNDLPCFPDGLDLREFTLETTLSVGKEHIPLLGKFDRLKTDYTALKDWKTGKNPWTQAKVNKDKQITFYCMMIFIEKKIIPHDIEVVWIPTEEDEQGRLKITGEFVRFHTTRKMSDILNMMVETRKTWKEISERYEQELLK